MKSVSPEGLILVDPPIVVDGVVVPPVGVAVGVEVEVFVVLEKENQERMRQIQTRQYYININSAVKA